MTTPPGLFTKNRRAYYDYEILKEYEAGLVLTGGEVKSIMAHQVTIAGAFVTITSKTQEAWLLNAHVNQWPYDQTPNYDPYRTRKLLLKKREIQQLHLSRQQEHAVLVPLSLYRSHGKIKLKLALAKPLRKYDKRRRDKEKQEKRESQQIRA